MRSSLLAVAVQLAGAAQADTQPAPEIETAAPECDTCLARQNGKRALRDYLAKKRAEEEAGQAAELKDQNDE